MLRNNISHLGINWFDCVSSLFSGSPYSFEIVDSTQVKASGDGLSSVEVKRPATFAINTGPGGSASDIRVNVTCECANTVPVICVQ